MSLPYARLMAMVKVLEKSAKPDLELVARLKARAKATREATEKVQAEADLEAYLEAERKVKK